jgi:hypothetical protein
MQVQRNIEARSANRCCSGLPTGKNIIYIYVYVCVCVCSLLLVIQRAQRMRRITLSPVTSLAAQYIYTLSNKQHDF